MGLAQIVNFPLNLENYRMSSTFNPHTGKATFKKRPVYIKYVISLSLKILGHNNVSASE